MFKRTQRHILFYRIGMVISAILTLWKLPTMRGAGIRIIWAVIHTIVIVLGNNRPGALTKAAVSTWFGQAERAGIVQK